MLQLRALTKAYAGKPAVQDVTLEIEEDEYVTLLGPSGSGKTTLLRLIAGLERPDAGSIWLNGTDITERPAHLRDLGFVQQTYALFPHMSVAENVGFGLRHRLIDPVSDATEVQRRVDAVLELVGLTGLDARMVGQLSGGQKQRVSLARTLVTEPKVCLLDEPLGALDANLRERMTVELRKIREKLGVTFLHVTGNEAEALAMGDRMIVLDEGRCLQVAEPDVMFRSPGSVHVARFVNAYNLLEGQSSPEGFRVGTAALPLPAGMGDIRHYAVRHDAAEIQDRGATAPDGHPALSATFIASEFMGSRIVYFFRLPTGDIFEVERHLSRADPVVFETGESRTISWDAASALCYDRHGSLVTGADARGVA